MRALYVVDKPLGWSSHQTVVAVRKTLGVGKAGHLGTLDPLATGVLVIAAGPATKLIPFLERSDKTYLAWVALGAGSETLDAEGPLSDLAVRPQPPVEQLLSALTRVAACLEQVPPAHSAVRVSGRRAYRLTRAGEAPILPPRKIQIHELTLLGQHDTPVPSPVQLSKFETGWSVGEPAHALAYLPAPLASVPIALIRARVTAGTYLRAIARDLGKELGVPAHLAGLVRVASGPFDLGQAVAPHQVGEGPGLDPASILPWPGIALTPEELAMIRQGRPLPSTLEGPVVLKDERGNLAAIALGDGSRLRPRRVWYAGEWDTPGQAG